MTETFPDIQARPHFKPRDAKPIDPTEGKTVAEIFGEIVWLMTQDKSCGDMRIGDLERLVMPAILLRQFHIVYAPVSTDPAVRSEPQHEAQGSASTTNPQLQPVKAEIFALVSDEVAARLDLAKELPAPLTLQDWRSGPRKRVIATVTLLRDDPSSQSDP